MSIERQGSGEGGRGFALFVLAYRCAMAEISGLNETYRQGVWEVLDAAAPDGEADALIVGMFGFVRSLAATAERPIEWRSAYCAHLCRDEWLAVSMIDAAQRADPAALLGFASELIGGANLGDALNAAQTLASDLARRRLYLRPGVCCSGGLDLCPKRTLH